MKKKSKAAKAKKGKGPKKFAYLEDAKKMAALEQSRETEQAKAKALAKRSDLNGLMTLEQAKEHAEHGRQLTRDALDSWWLLAWHANDGIEHGAPQALGMSQTKWYQEIFRGPWQMVRRHVEHLKRLQGIPLSELGQIPDCNAYAMRLLPENLRTTKQWLDAAKNETGEAFTEAVYAKRRELGIQDEAMVKTGTVVKINSLPASLAPLVKDCMEHAAREHELDLTKKEGKIDAIQAIFSDYHITHCVEVPEETI